MCGLFIKATRFLCQRLFCLNTTIWSITARSRIMDDHAIVTSSSGAVDVTRNADFDFGAKKNAESITMLWQNVTGNALTCHFTGNGINALTCHFDVVVVYYQLLFMFNLPSCRVSCEDDEERASRKVQRGCFRLTLCKGCTTCVCFGCEICRFQDCTCQTCIDFTNNT